MELEARRRATARLSGQGGSGRTLTAQVGQIDLNCYRSLGRLGLESLAVLWPDGLVVPAEIASIIGRIFLIAH